MSQRATFCLELALMALNNLVFFLFWWALFLKVPNIRGQGLADVANLFGIVAIGYGLQVVFAGGARDLSRLIVDGAIDAHLAQPKPVLWALLGSRSQASGIGDVLSGVALICLFGHPNLNSAALIVVASLASAAVLTASVTIVSSLGFWCGSNDALERQFFETLLSFSLYPERIFDGRLKLVLYTVVPAGFIGYLPARLISEPTIGSGVILVSAAVAYLMLANWVFRIGLRHYTSGSRFGIQS